MPTYRNEGNDVVLIQGIGRETVRLGPGESGESYQIYEIEGLVRTGDAPVWQVAGDVHEVEFAGAGVEEVEIDVETPVLEIRAGVAVEVRANAGAGKMYPIPAGETRLLANRRTIGKLILTAAGAGVVTVVELPE